MRGGGPGYAPRRRPIEKFSPLMRLKIKLSAAITPGQGGAASPAARDRLEAIEVGRQRRREWGRQEKRMTAAPPAQVGSDRRARWPRHAINWCAWR